MDSLVSFKVFFNEKETKEVEVRRLAVPQTLATNFSHICEKIVEVFPKLKNISYSVNWKDDEGDEITISSDIELIIAVTEIKHDIKKLYIKCKGVESEFDSGNTLHPNIYCDGCQKSVIGYRYKCVLCKDFDLCQACEKNFVHSEHPMLRISNPYLFDNVTLYKLVKIFSSCASHKLDEKKHHHHNKKRHCPESANTDSCRKKKCEKQETAVDTDDSEGGNCKRHNRRKLKKKLEMYKEFLSDYLQYLDPELQKGQPRKTNEGNAGQQLDLNYLSNIGKTITSYLEPFGIDVDFEVRSNKETPKKPDDDTKKKQTPETDKEASTSPRQKEVHFEASNDLAETLEKTVENLSKILANQKVSESPEKDDWEEFEELKAEATDSSTKMNLGAIPKTNSAPQAKVDEVKILDKNSAYIPSAPKQENLYPRLLSETSLEPHILAALNKMLEMGYENDGYWLTSLAIAKNGDIEEMIKSITRT